MEFDGLDVPLGLEDHLGQEIPGDLVHPVKQCNSLKPIIRHSSASSWDYSPGLTWSLCQGTFALASHTWGKAKGFIFLSCSSLYWKRDFAAHGNVIPESG